MTVFFIKEDFKITMSIVPNHFKHKFQICYCYSDIYIDSKSLQTVICIRILWKTYFVFALFSPENLQVFNPSSVVHLVEMINKML